MYYDEQNNSLPFLAGLLAGTLLGAGLALLTAPQSGKRTRRRLVRVVSGAREAATGRLADLSEEVDEVVRRRRGRG